jgi:hypothetical protein
MIMRRLGILIVLLLSVAGSVLATEGVSQVEILPDGLRFVLTAPPADPQLVEREGEPASLEWEGFASCPEQGGLQLPVRTVWIGLPIDGQATVSYETLDARPLASTLASALPSSQLLSRQTVEAGTPQWMRDQEVMPISWRPVTRSTGTPTAETAVRVSVRFSGLSREAGARATDDGWEGVYSGLLLNYEQARSWRRLPGAARAARSASFWSRTSGPRVRIEVAHTGLHAITGADLQAVGIDITAIDPDSLRLFTGSGVSLPETASVFDLPSDLDEIAVRLDGVADGTFDPQDRILFHAVGPDAWYSDLGQPDARHERYREDEFSNVNTYWLVWSAPGSTPRRWGAIDGTAVSLTPDTTAFQRAHYESDEIWDPRPRTVTGLQPPYPDTLPAWEKWHWVELIASRSNLRYPLPFVLPDPVADADATMRIRMWGATYTYTGTEPDHMLRLDLNGHQIAERTWDDLDHRDIVVTGLRFASESQTLGMQTPYRGDTTSVTTDRQYLGWFEIEYRRHLLARGDSLEFWIEPDIASRAFTVNGLGATGEILTLDVTNPRYTIAIGTRLESTGTLRSATWQVVGDPDHLRHIRVMPVSSAARPHIVLEPVPERGYLRDRTDRIDYIVITNGAFETAAQTLADWRSAHGPGRTLNTAVVDVQDIYDEFSAGRIDPTAIRNFLRWAYQWWNGGDPTHHPTYVVFLGDASFDFRNRLKQGASVYVPSYEGYYDPVLRHSIYQPQFATDDWYVLFDPPPDGSLDMAAGRLPADGPVAAAALVEKVIEYESAQAPGSWRQRFTLVADDICQGLQRDALGYTHMRQTEALADSLPDELFRDRIYLYEYGNECIYDRKPAAAAALRQRIDDGTLVVNYTGHGSEGQLADERVLETSSVASLSNRDRLFFFLTASCSVGKFNFAGTGLGEALVRQPRGGAIGVFSATAVAFSGANAELNRAFFNSVWPDRNVLQAIPLGDAAVLAKSSVGNPAGLNNRRYPLLGEPAIVLLTPRLRCAMTLRGLRGGGASPDTIYRGGRAELHGTIVDWDSQHLSEYTGNVGIEVYDSEILRRLEDTGGFGNIAYNLIGSPIFRGTVPVTAGQFDLSFIAPAALRTGTRGSASVYAYAENGEEVGAIGAIPNLEVPEIAPETSSDQQGPAITVRPLTVTSLDAVPIDAVWQATLEDSSGINITQLVPSRSVLMRIEEGSRIVHLQDLAPAVTFPEDASRGIVEFELPATLESGVPYRMTVEASDNRDHRASTSVDFTIQGAGSGGLEFARVYNVPNPADGPTTFFLEINRPAHVEIRIFTSTGRTIQEIRPLAVVQPAEAAAEGIPWDGRDKDGDVLGNGVYFYKVTVRDAEGAHESRIERLAVSR